MPPGRNTPAQRTKAKRKRKPKPLLYGPIGQVETRPERAAKDVRRPPQALTDVGIPSVAELNRRLDRGTQAYIRAFGRRPSAAMAYDLVRMPLADHEYPRLFDVVSDPRRVKIRQSLRTAVGDLTEQLGVMPVGGPTLGGLERRVYGPAPYLVEQGMGAAGPLASDNALPDDKPGAILRTTSAQTWDNRFEYAGAGGTTLLINQFFDGLAGIPGGVAYLAKAVGLDVRDIGSEIVRNTAVRGLRAAGLDVDLKHRDLTPGRSVQLAKDSANLFWEMMENPGAHPGDLLLLAAGLLAGPVVGTATRITSAAGALSAAKAVGLSRPAAISAATTRFVMGPPPQHFTMAVGASQVTIPLSRNFLWAQYWQKGRLAGKERTLQARYEGTGAPPMRYGDFRDSVAWIFSPERTFERAWLRKQRIEMTLRTAPINEVERFGRWQTNRELFMTEALKVPWVKQQWQRSLAGLSSVPGFKDRTPDTRRAAIEKAIEVLATDDYDPLALHRSAHTRWAQGGIGDPDLHQGQLELLDMAEKILDDPPDGFLDLFEAVRRMTAHAEELKAIYKGVDRKRLARRVALHAAVYRGHILGVSLPGGLVPGKDTRASLARSYKKLEGELKRLETIAIRREAEFRLPTEFTYTRVARPMTIEQVRDRLDYLDELHKTTLTYLADLDKKRQAKGKEGSVTPEAYVEASQAIFVLRNSGAADADFEQYLRSKGVERDGAPSWKARAATWLRDLERNVGAGATETTVAPEILLQRLLESPGVNPDVKLLQDMMRERGNLQGIVNDAERGLGVPTVWDEDVAVTRIEDPLDPDIWKATRERIRVLETALRMKAGMRGTKNKRVNEQAEKLARDWSEVIIAKELETLRRDLDRMGGTDPLAFLYNAQARRVARLQAGVQELESLLDAKARLELSVADPQDRAPYAQGYQPFYFPSESAERTAAKRKRGAGRTISDYGVKSSADIDSLEHEFLGSNIIYGKHRIDITSLSAESTRRTVRAVARIEAASMAWDVSVALRPGSEVPHGYIPIRNVKNVPPELRRIMAEIDDGTIRESVVGQMDDSILTKMDEWLWPPADKQLLSQEMQAGTVRWVDERFVVWRKNEWEDMARAFDNGVAKVMFAPNELMRLTNLFLRPAYILNALGAEILAIIQQGFLAPIYLGKAIHAKAIWGEDFVRQAEQLAQTGRSMSYVTEGGSMSPSRFLAEKWMLITDRHQRISALLFELERQGIKHDEMRKAVGLEGEVPPELRAKVVEATERTRRAMVDFDLMPFEKAVLRHIFFVYAWFSRSAVWSVNAIVDHPAMTAVQAHLGNLNQEEIEAILGPAKPDWLNKLGGSLLYTGQDHDGRPMFQMWSQLSSYQSLPELKNLGVSLFLKRRYRSVDELFTGTPTLFQRIATGRGEFGEEFERGTLLGAGIALFGETAFGALLSRLQDEQEEELPAVDPMDKSVLSMVGGTNPLAQREAAALEQNVWTPRGWEQSWGPVIFGGPARRVYNIEAAAARYWRDSDPEENHAHEIRQINKMIVGQAKIMGRKVPDDLRAAVKVMDRHDRAVLKWEKENHMEPGPRDDIRIWIGAGVNEGVLTKATAAMLTRALKAADDPDEIEAVKTQVLVAVSRQAVAEWDEDVREFAKAYEPDNIRQATRVLTESGLGADTRANEASEPQRQKYARAYLKWLKEDERKRRDLDQGRITEGDYQAFLEQTDESVVIDGISFPSPQRFGWARLTESQRRKQVFDAANGDWQDVSAFERELLGRTTATTVVAGWREIDRLKDEYRRNTGASQVRREQVLRLARQMDADPRFKGIYEDALFAYQPPYRRFQELSVYRRSENRSDWDKILAAAEQANQALNSGRWAKGLIRSEWERYIEENVMPWVNDVGGSFLEEVDAMGSTFMNGMIG